MYLDSHQHFWTLSRGDYAWMTPDFKPIYKDFTSEDLGPLIKEKKITETVIVQAADTVAETDFILDIARQTPYVKGVVGWVDFEDSNVKSCIDRLSQNPLLKGFRPMIHDIKDVNWMLKDTLTESLDYLVKKGLSFDALVRPHHLKNLLVFAKKYPDLPIVIDHIAKPVIPKGEIDEWLKDMSALASLDNIWCKFSGIVTEIGENYTKGQIVPYVERIFELFESQRIMWGSDWPVLTMVESYGNWFDLAQELCSVLSDDEQLNIFSRTARNFYRIE